jgi:hypothetical protein
MRVRACAVCQVRANAEANGKTQPANADRLNTSSRLKAYHVLPSDRRTSSRMLTLADPKGAELRPERKI